MLHFIFFVNTRLNSNTFVIFSVLPPSLDDPPNVFEVRQLQYKRRIVSNNVLGPLMLELPSKEKFEVTISFKDNIIWIRKKKSKDPIFSLDLFIYEFYKNSENSFCLVKGSENFVFEPLNDSLSTWINLLEQLSWEIQTRFLQNASSEFYETAVNCNENTDKKNPTKPLKAAVKIKFSETGEYHSYNIVIVLETIQIFENDCQVSCTSF